MKQQHYFDIAGKEDFDEVYTLLEASFPKSERRSYHRQLALLDRPEYTLYTRRDDRGSVQAFLAVWHFDAFDFIEHAAVSEKARGKGIGSAMFKAYMEEHPKSLFLEVEYPETEMAKRRIRFYRHLGFELNDYEYRQPGLWENAEDLLLYVMTWPEALEKNVFEQRRKMIKATVYRQCY